MMVSMRLTTADASCACATGVIRSASKSASKDRFVDTDKTKLDPNIKKDFGSGSQVFALNQLLWQKAKIGRTVSVS